ncbi:MAG: phosphate butyryltransferase [Candidatus Adiutrix sp.]|jgi:phosphate butyryltransferase|nr:phosphate butyryltransferase [Candidatus Adiutrix sp.]
MYKNFDEVIAAAKQRGPQTISVAVAQDLDVLLALKAAEDQGLVKPLLVGEAAAIKPLAEKAGLAGARVVDEADQDEAARKAAELVRTGEAQVLMKGLINSSNFLKAVLDKERGLRKSKLLCHLGVFDTPGVGRLMYMSDGGMNVAPDLEAKKEILINVLATLKNMGLDKPNVAVMSHNEQVNAKMPSTTDAAALVEMGVKGELPPCVIDGPRALDVAASAEAAHHKKIDSKISGAVDVYLMPNIESGNMVGKALIHYAGAKMAGLVLGASHPVVLASRSDTPEGKLCSIALACLSAPR